jgi:hypothetical protein
MSADETTPLLSGLADDPKHQTKSKQHVGLASALRKAFDVEKRILFAGFLITLSFSFTQVPYVSSGRPVLAVKTDLGSTASFTLST